MQLSQLFLHLLYSIGLLSKHHVTDFYYPLIVILGFLFIPCSSIQVPQPFSVINCIDLLPSKMALKKNLRRGPKKKIRANITQVQCRSAKVKLFLCVYILLTYKPAVNRLLCHVPYISPGHISPGAMVNEKSLDQPMLS